MDTGQEDRRRPLRGHRRGGIWASSQAGQSQTVDTLGIVERAFTSYCTGGRVTFLWRCLDEDRCGLSVYLGSSKGGALPGKGGGGERGQDEEGKGVWGVLLAVDPS